ncbi:MAG: hypothetical protein ACKPKO_03730, partial [Candidatus Fonsibacter sp.]
MDILIHIHHYLDHHPISTQKLLFINLCALRTDSYQDTTMKLDFAILTFTVSKTGNGYINSNFDCGGLLTAPNIYNKTQVDNLLTGKQNALIFRDPTQFNPLVQGFPLLGGGNIVPGIAVVPPLSLTYYGNDYIEIGVDLSQKADKSTTYTKSEVDSIASTKQA